jgi:hypothetical protein
MDTAFVMLIVLLVLALQIAVVIAQLRLFSIDRTLKLILSELAHTRPLQTPTPDTDDSLNPKDEEGMVWLCAKCHTEIAMHKA